MTWLYWTIALAGIALIATAFPDVYRAHKAHQERVRTIRRVRELTRSLRDLSRIIEGDALPELEKFSSVFRAFYATTSRHGR